MSTKGETMAAWNAPPPAASMQECDRTANFRSRTTSASCATRPLNVSSFSGRFFPVDGLFGAWFEYLNEILSSEWFGLFQKQKLKVRKVFRLAEQTSRKKVCFEFVRLLFAIIKTSKMAKVEKQTTWRLAEFWPPSDKKNICSTLFAPRI